MMLKLKLHYFGHLRRRVDSLEKTLMLGRMGAAGPQVAGKLSRCMTVPGMDISPGDVTPCHVGDQSW